MGFFALTTCSRGSSVVGGAAVGGAAVGGGDASNVIPAGPPAFTDLTPDIDRAPPFPVLGLDLPAPETTIGIFADLDGDGVPEVILSGSGASSFPGRRPALYRQREGALVLDTTTPLPELGMVLSGVDVDGDGLPDLVGSSMPNNVEWGLGGGAFSPRTDLTLGRFTVSTPRPGPGNVTYADVDGDGWLDVLLEGSGCCATCRALVLLLRDGPRSFADYSSLVSGNENTFAGCAVASLPIGPDPPVLLVLGSACDIPAALADQSLAPKVFFPRTGRTADGYPLFTASEAPLPLPSILMPTSRPGSAIGNRAPMGAAVGDFDGDEHQDLLVTLDPILLLLAGQPTFPMADRSYNLQAGYPIYMGDPVVLSERGHRQVPWSVAPLDLDGDGRPDLIITYGYDNDLWVGPKHNTVGLNRGGFRFEDATPRSGLGVGGEWHSIAVGDLEGDGRPDVIVGQVGLRPHAYRNRWPTPNGAIALRLHGTTSNHLGVGARVTVEAGPGVPAQHFSCGSIFNGPYSEPLIFAGLGPHASAERVRIRWPSGTTQELGGLAAGRIHDVTEPRVLEVAPASRHAPADGASVATLRITPRDARGAPRLDARVEVAVTYGTARLAAPPAREGDAIVARVVAPAVRSTSVVEVRIDGVPLGVHPRLWWD